MGVVHSLGVDGYTMDYRLEFLTTSLSDLLISSIILIVHANHYIYQIQFDNI